MKAITITIPEELDSAAAAEARRLGLSKSELIRRGLLAILSKRPPTDGADPWVELAAFGTSGLGVEQGEIDATVYGT